MGRDWLDGCGGCLVTHNPMFSGMEASMVFYITEDMLDPGVRSGMLRGVSRLVLVTSTGLSSELKKILEQSFNVIIL